MKEKVILAYSGGLDTTAIIPWLKENFDYEVICVCVDCGQGNELDGLEERAKYCGAEKLYIENVVDESPAGVVDRATVRIGDANPAWGGVTPLGDAYGFTIRNIESRSRQAILIAGSLADSSIENVKDYNPESQGVCYESGVDNVRNVRVEGVVHVDDAPVLSPKTRD